VLDLARLGPADVLFTEMLPTPDQLWWTVDGQAQCAEIRLGLLVSAGLVSAGLVSAGAAGADHG